MHVDQQLESCYKALQMLPPREYEARNLRNWIYGNSPIARKESAFINADDLISLSTVIDPGLTHVEHMVECALIKLYRIISHVSLGVLFISFGHGRLEYCLRL